MGWAISSSVHVQNACPDYLHALQLDPTERLWDGYQ